MRRKRKQPILTEIDLRKATGHECPGIVAQKHTYLALIDGKFHVGRFTREWYGLNFDAVYDAGLQFDAPGENQSDWQRVWRIDYRVPSEAT